MKLITKEMIKIYKMKDICWMGYKASENNPYTFHHLNKVEDGGEMDIKNGAILTFTAHEYLHIIESYDLDIYLYLNNVLRCINEQNYFPTKKQLVTIDEMLKMFEGQYLDVKNSRNKKIVKSQFYDRIYYNR